MAYLQKGRSAKSAALGFTLALNGAALVAAFAWNPSFVVKPFDPPIETIPIRSYDPPPPPPRDAEPVERKVTRTETVVPTPGGDTAIAPEPDEPFVIPPQPGPVIPPEPRVEPIKPPPAPVRVGAKLDLARSDLQPPYPPALQRAEQEGSVTVRIRLGTDGRPLAIELVQADDPGFFAATRNWGMRHWRFRPATEDGRPVESVTTLTVRFQLNR